MCHCASTEKQKLKNKPMYNEFDLLTCNRIESPLKFDANLDYFWNGKMAFTCNVSYGKPVTCVGDGESHLQAISSATK